MLGVIVQSWDQQGESNQAVYERILTKTILEHTVFNCLKAELIQKIVVVGPLSDRRAMVGGGIYNPGLRTDLEALKRRPQLYFGEAGDNPLDIIYHAALKHELDNVILVHGNSPLIQPWLINEFARISNQNNQKYLNNFDYPNGLHLSSFSFAMLADAFLYSENRMQVDPLISKAHGSIEMKNDPLDEDLWIEPIKKDMRFSNISQANEFEFLLSELDKGAEINELFRDLNDK